MEEEEGGGVRVTEPSAGEALLDAAMASGQLAPQPLTEYERLEPSHGMFALVRMWECERGGRAEAACGARQCTSTRVIEWCCPYARTSWHLTLFC